MGTVVYLVKRNLIEYWLMDSVYVRRVIFLTNQIKFVDNATNTKGVV